MADRRPVVVYGASGFSGRLVAEFLREYNVPFVAAGRDRARIEEVLDHVPGIGTADYEVVQVGHTGRRADRAPAGREGRLQQHRAVHLLRRHGDRGRARGRLPLPRHGGEAPWVRRVRETWHERFAEAGLLVAPATAYMSATAETAIRVAQEQRRASTRSRCSRCSAAPDLRLDADDLRPAPVGVVLPRAERVRRVAAGDDDRGGDPGHVPDAARAPVGRLPAPDLVQGRPADRERLRVRRDPQPRDHGERRRRAARLPGEDPAAAARGAAEILAGIADSVQAGMPPRENRRQQRTVDVVSARGNLESIQIVVHGVGRVPPDRVDPGVRRAPSRLPAAARGRLRLAVHGVRLPRALAALEAYGMVRMKIVG